jgi:hypothetical protein
MYDDLVKRLRAQADAERYFVGEDMLYDKAADAIEALSKLALDEHNRAAVAAWERRWIPVSERKPKTNDIVIVAIHDDSGDTPYDVTNVGFYLDVFPLGVWVVENERCNYVTHWMQLPQPPKEE